MDPVFDNCAATACYNRTPARTVGVGHAVRVGAVSDSAVFGQDPLPRMETSHVECGSETSPDGRTEAI